MAKVTGIGGVFFKSRDPAALSAWYRDHLGFDIQPWGGAVFEWKADHGGGGCSVWNPFPEDTAYFEPSDRSYMLNLRVDDVDALVAAMRQAGQRVLDRAEDAENGKFRYVLDPEGNLLELWQPTEPDPDVP
jgi:catechol 2,3-dioxygenase-like lactoylglutathione lyase family enzyme